MLYIYAINAIYNIQINNYSLRYIITVERIVICC